jgi:hypothetical protein
MSKRSEPTDKILDAYDLMSAYTFVTGKPEPPPKPRKRPKRKT